MRSSLLLWKESTVSRDWLTIGVANRAPLLRTLEAGHISVKQGKETLCLEELEDNKVPEVVMQTTARLPFLDDQVPVLSLSDGRPYVPVFAVCRVLGIRPDIYIRRWRRLALWATARKLPF